MAEGIAHEAGWESYSAGTKPENKVNPFAVKVMAEIEIDISHHTPKSISKYLDEKFYIVATICDNVREDCPVLPGNSEQNIHHGFEDPADITGSDNDIMEVYRRVRDEIQEWVKQLT